MSETLQRLGLLAVTGAIGTLARYWLGGLVYRVCGTGFPWGTFTVNVLGCFLFGVVWVLAEERLLIKGETRFVILTGFMGAFTTFSTFAFETHQLVRDSEWLLAAGNVIGQVALGFLGLFVGIALGRLF